MGVAADHVGNLHVGVVDCDREVVENGAIGASDHRVVLEVVAEADLAADRVGDDCLAIVGNPEPNGRIGRIGRCAAVPATGVRVAELADVGAGRGVAVCLAGGEQVLEPLSVPWRPLGLADRPLVPVELEPAQGVEDLLDVAGGGALGGVSSQQLRQNAREQCTVPYAHAGWSDPSARGEADRRGAAG